MNGSKVSPSRSVLIQLRQEEKFVRGGKEILSRKREVLITEMMVIKEQTEKLHAEADAQIANIYELYRDAVMAEGSGALLRLSSAIPPPELPEISYRRIMGIGVPQLNKDDVKSEHKLFNPLFSIVGLTVDTDRTINELSRLIPLLVDLAAHETTLCRLAVEVRKTLQREKALEQIFLPEFKKKITFIEDSLEEREREEYSRMKLLKHRQTNSL